MDTCFRHGEEPLKDFYITLKNRDSNKFFPNNKPEHFRVKLQERLKVLGQWKVALCEFHTTTRIGEAVYVCSNLTSSYIADGSLGSALRYIPDTRRNSIFESPYYINIDGHEYDMIEIYIADEAFNPMSFDVEQVTCTLHFKQV